MTELPANWHRDKIGNHCLNVEKVDPVQLGRKTFKYIDIGALESNSSSLENVSNISTESAPGRARQLVRTGDSLFATVRPYMKKIAYITDPYSGEIASTGFCVLRPESEKLQPKFLFYFLQSDELLDQVLPLQRGVSYPAIRDNDLKNAIVPIPPLPEQHKIVEILEDHLSRLDAALADVKQAKVKAAQFRRSLLQAAFTGNLGSDGTRLMTSEKLIPFGKTFDILSNSGKSLKQKDYLTEGAFRVIDQGEKFIGGFTNRGDLVLDFGTPIIVFGDHTRNIKLVDGPFVPGADGTKLLRPKSEINLKFAFYQLNSKELRNRGYARHFSELKKESFWIPPLPVQHKIVEILEDHLSRLDASIALADAMEKQSAGLRRSLLQAAFTGQLTKEVASV